MRSIRIDKEREKRENSTNLEENSSLRRNDPFATQDWKRIRLSLHTQI